MRIENLQDVFHHQLKDLYSAEQQLLEALPKMANAAATPELTDAFNHHLKQTREHFARLEEVSDICNLGISGENCEAMEGLIDEGEELIGDNKGSDALDAALIAAAQRIEHYEIAAYGSARTYAEHLGFDEAAKILQASLDEEAETDKKLTKLAEEAINKQALKT